MLLLLVPLGLATAWYWFLASPPHPNVWAQQDCISPCIAHRVTPLPGALPHGSHGCTVKT